MIRITAAGMILTLAAAAVSAQEKTAPESKTAPPVADAEQVVLKDYGFGWCLNLSFSPDQKELFRSHAFGQVMTDTTSWKKARVFNIGIRMMAYSPDGKLLATAEGTDGARIWNAADPGKRQKESPDGLLEISVLEKPRRVLLAPFQSSTQKVLWAAFSPDSSRLLTADSSGHVKIWNAASGAREADITLTTEVVGCAEFHPDGKSVVFGDAKGVLHLWDLEQKKEIGISLTALGGIVSLAYAPDGKRLAAAYAAQSGERGVMIWDTASWVAQIERGYNSAEFSKDGKVLALGGNDIRLLEVPSGRPIRNIALPELSLRETQASPDPKASDQKLRVSVMALAWQPDGKQLAAGCLDGTVRLVPIENSATSDGNKK